MPNLLRGSIERKFRCSDTIPAFTIKLAGELNDLLGAAGKERMSLKDAEAIGPDPHFLGFGIQMPVVNDRAGALIDDDLEITVAWRAKTGLNDATKSCAGLGDKLSPGPRSRDAVVPIEMAKLYRTVVKTQGHHDIEPMTPTCAQGGLDQASGSGHNIPLIGDP
jgi:hypothetical protein